MDCSQLTARTAQPRGSPEETGMTARDQPRDGWTVVLRRQPARIVNGQAEGPYTDAFEIICCQCGDDPRLPYPEVPPKLQLIRGPYPIVVGIVAYEEHLMLHDQTDAAYQPRG